MTRELIRNGFFYTSILVSQLLIFNHFNLNSLGEHFAINALATLAAVNIVTGNFISAIKSLNSWRPPSGRGEHIIVKFDNDNPNLYFDLIDDSYNSNPTSLKAGLMLLRNIHEMRNVSKKGTGKRTYLSGVENCYR